MTKGQEQSGEPEPETQCEDFLVGISKQQEPIPLREYRASPEASAPASKAEIIGLSPPSLSFLL